MARAGAGHLLADGARASLLLGAIALAVGGRGHAAFGMALVALAALALRAADVPAGLDLAFAGLLALDAWLTAAGAFESFNREDRPGHFVLCALATAVLHQLATQLEVVAERPPPALPGRIAFVLTVAAGGLALGTAWELVEYGADAVLGTNMSLGYGDTLGDLVADAAGALTAALALSWWLSRGAVARERTTSS